MEPESNLEEKKPREGWAEAFKQYAEQGEDEILFPDYLDDELEIYLE
jgi:hypothetical protein